MANARVSSRHGGCSDGAMMLSVSQSTRFLLRHAVAGEGFPLLGASAAQDLRHNSLERSIYAGSRLSAARTAEMGEGAVENCQRHAACLLQRT